MLHHETITVLDPPTPEGEPVYRISDALISEGEGFIETATRKIEGCTMNQRNSNKLACLLAGNAIIHVDFDSVRGMLGRMYDPRETPHDNNTVFFTTDTPQ